MTTFYDATLNKVNTMRAKAKLGKAQKNHIHKEIERLELIIDHLAAQGDLESQRRIPHFSGILLEKLHEHGLKDDYDGRKLRMCLAKTAPVQTSPSDYYQTHHA